MGLHDIVLCMIYYTVTIAFDVIVCAFITSHTLKPRLISLGFIMRRSKVKPASFNCSQVKPASRSCLHVKPASFNCLWVQTV